jgi:hypothetical protein
MANDARKGSVKEELCAIVSYFQNWTRDVDLMLAAAASVIFPPKRSRESPIVT